MAKFSIGDTVRISDKGKQEYDNADDNPYDVTGTVTLVVCENTDRAALSLFEILLADTGLTINVTWLNGKTNCYREDELDIVA